MAIDNTTLNVGNLGDIIATKNRGGVKFQKVLVDTFDGIASDAFGRWRVSIPSIIFSTKLLNIDDASLAWDEALESGGGITASTPTAARPYIDFTSTDVTAGVFTRQTFRRFNYQPGKSYLILMTGVLELASGVRTGCERRIGYFDDNNGAFFESDAGTIGVTVRSNDSGTPIDTTIAQALWNLDVMDGGDTPTNPSGVTLDITQSQIFFIDFQWPGRVRFGLEIDGVLIYVHEHLTENSATIPWTSTPNLPLRYQIITTADSGVCTMRCISAAVIVEGGAEPSGITRRVSTAGSEVTSAVENTLYALIGLRLKSTHVGTTVSILRTAIQVQTSSEFIEWVLLFNPTVAGVFTFADLVNSSCQTVLGLATNTVSGGTEVAGDYLESGKDGGSAGDTFLTLPKLGVAIDGTLDTYVLAFRPIGGVSAASCEGALAWRER